MALARSGPRAGRGRRRRCRRRRASAVTCAVLADAAEDRRWCVRPSALASGSTTARDLGGELAGRHEDQRARAAGAGACCPRRPSRATSGRPKARVLPEPVRPRPSTSRPARRVGQRGDLDRERRGDAAGGEHLDQRRGHAEGGEGGVGGQHGGVGARRGRRPAPGRRPAGRLRAGWCWAGCVAGGAAAATAAAAASGGDGCPRSRWRTRGSCWVRSSVPQRSGGRTSTSASASAGAPARGQGGLASSARRRSAGRTSVAQPQPDVDSCRSG